MGSENQTDKGKKDQTPSRPRMFAHAMSKFNEEVRFKFERSVGRFDEEALRWMEIASEEIGVKEIPDPGENPRIVEYHSTTTYGSTDDEVNWCSSFVNWCMQYAGVIGTDSVAARSWLNWGRSLPAPRFGCIVVFWRESPSSWKGHVGFCYREPEPSDKVIYILGGNQANAVNVSAYTLDRVLGYRWPEDNQ